MNISRDYDHSNDNRSDYPPPTKLGKDNIFTRVCLLTPVKKIVRFGDLTFTNLSIFGTSARKSQSLFKPVGHTSIGKRAVGLPLKAFLFSYRFYRKLNGAQIDTVKNYRNSRRRTE